MIIDDVKGEKRRRMESVTFYVAPEQVALMNRAAALTGFSKSALLRAALDEVISRVRAKFPGELA